MNLEEIVDGTFKYINDRVYENDRARKSREVFSFNDW